MKKYQQQFIEFLVNNRSLQFGEFTLKSGRQSPYFINTKVLETGEAIKKLGFFFASLIKDEFNDGFDVIFGPAYGGIPLAIAACIALETDFGLNKYFAYNRKEIKNHGDKRIVDGHALKDGDRLIMIDDVITDGGTKFETVELINSLAKVEYQGLVVAVNRQEKTKDGLDAFKNIEDQLKFPVKAIVSVGEIMEYLTDKEIDGQVYLTKAKAEEMENYLKKYGV